MPDLSRTDFLSRLGISHSTFYTLLKQGLLPPPPRLPGTRIIRWNTDYLARCRAGVAESRALDRTRRSLTVAELRALQRGRGKRGTR